MNTDAQGKEPGHRRRLLVTDLDGTFIGDDGAMTALWDELDERDILLAFSTGRHLESVLDFYAAKRLARRAMACLCMVGTDIYLWDAEGYRLVPGWHEIISVEWDKDAVERVLRSIPEAHAQPAEWQSPFKSSYYLEENAEARLAEIRHRLAERGLRAKVVYSADRFLDLLPVRSGKGEAVRFLAASLGVPRDQVVTCGDTGNDLDMMRPELGVRSIVVGNAAAELRRFRSARVYHAQAPYAAGIHEGLRVYGWI
jgi:sucrose phosphatase-like protein